MTTWTPIDLEPDDEVPLYVFYRLSDNSYKKPRFPGSIKEVCLSNFLDAFPDSTYICLIADNCDGDTTRDAIELICDYRMQPPYWTEEHITNLGNAGAFRKALDMACDLPDETIVYFLEDDYVHLRTHFKYQPTWDSPWNYDPYKLLCEGLTVGHYATLQDHPDKYNEQGGGEKSEVWRTESTHWKQTISTTMTFASKAKWIKKDREVWLKHTEGDHPNDHEAFVELGKIGRCLVSSIPGGAVHCDYSASPTGRLPFSEEWAYRCIEEGLKKAIVYNDGDSFVESIKKKTEELEKLLPEGNTMKRLLLMESIRMSQRYSNSEK